MNGSEADLINLLNTEKRTCGLWIDNSGTFERVSVIIGSLLIIMMCFRTGAFGADPVIKRREEHKFNSTDTNVFKFRLSPISGYNRYLRCDVSLVPVSSSVSSVILHMSLAGNATHYGQPVTLDPVTFPPTKVNFRAGRQANRVTVFNDKYIKYESVTFSLSVPNMRTSGIDALAGDLSFGTSDHTTFRSYFTTVFWMFQVFALYDFVQSIIVREFWAWMLERQVSFLCLVAAVVGDNPIYALHAYMPSPIWDLLDVVGAPMMHAVVYFGLVVLMTSVVKVEASLSWEEQSVNGIIAGAIFGAEVMEGLAGFISGVATIPTTGMRMGKMAAVLGIAAHLAFVVHAMSLVSKAVPSIREKSFRAMLYSILTVVLVALDLIVLTVGKALGWVSNKENEWVYTFVVHNCCIFVIAYVHGICSPMHKYDGTEVAQGDNRILGRTETLDEMLDESYDDTEEEGDDE